MKNTRSAVIGLLLAAMLPATVVLAQEEMPMERPEAGFVVLGPRTVVSFVRQTVPGDVAAEVAEIRPLWNTVLHVSNTGGGVMAGVAILVPETGENVRHLRFGPLAPGVTRTFGVADIIGADGAAPGDEIRGVVFLRFFTTEADARRHDHSQMVTAELFLDAGPAGPVQILPLDVERPQPLLAVRRVTPGR